MLTSLPHDGPATLLLPDIPAKDVVYLMSFIYCGQVDVPQTNIASFLNTGKLLQVLGLEQGDRVSWKLVIYLLFIYLNDIFITCLLHSR